MTQSVETTLSWSDAPAFQLGEEVVGGGVGGVEADAGGGGRAEGAALRPVGVEVGKELGERDAPGSTSSPGAQSRTSGGDELAAVGVAVGDEERKRTVQQEVVDPHAGVVGDQPTETGRAAA